MKVEKKRKVKASKRNTDIEPEVESSSKLAKLAKLDQLSQNYLKSLGVEIPEPSQLQHKKAEPNPEVDFKNDSLKVECSETNSTLSSLLVPSSKVSLESAVQPKVYKFVDTFSKTKSQKLSSGFKKFMSEKVDMLDRESKPIQPTSKKEEVEETRLKLQDKELEQLLSSTNLIERISTSELYGKKRRKNMLLQMEKGGAKAAVVPMPINERFKRISNVKRKEREAIEKAKEEGNFHHSIKHTFSASNETTTKDKNKKKPIHSTLKVSKGRVKDGLIEISKNHIKRNSFLAKQKGKISRFGKGNIKL